MKRVDTPLNGLPIKMWLNDIEESALEQAKNLSRLPFLHKHVALMPDCHAGYGMPIGGVIATKGVVIPNAVGKDIACGVALSKSDLIDVHGDKDKIKRIMNRIRDAVPMGLGKHHDKPQDAKLMPNSEGYGGALDPDYYPVPIVRENFESAHYQLGTLGSGRMIASRPSKIN